MNADHGLKDLLTRIYGQAEAERALARILVLIGKFPRRSPRKTDMFSPGDVTLIAYGDSLRRPGQAPLAVLGEFARTYLSEAVSTIHLLPFFPWSSDDGFSVQDFYAVNPDLGNWGDMAALGRNFSLQFDFVLNHFSSRSQWFENYLADRQGFMDLAIEVDPSADLSLVSRPRSLPLLSRYQKGNGRAVDLWTTFSADQIDFNYRSIDVLEKMIAVLLFYVEKGTPCIHLEQTHAMVSLFRAILDLAAPDVILLTETNVPHAENISYFGDGRNEAQMVYNFTLPPLLLHTFIKQDSRQFSEWVKGLKLDSPHTTFFNFTASHDGIGVRPLEGILSSVEVADIIAWVRACGGQVSSRRAPDGSDSPYELNISYVDAISGPAGGDLQARRFLASQAIQCVLPGVPATYIHSLLGSRNWLDGIHQTGRARTINRQPLMVNDVLASLQDPRSFRSQIFYPLREMMALRRRQAAFHPKAGFEVLDLDPRVFALRRQATGQTLVTLANVSDRPVAVAAFDLGIDGPVVDLISNTRVEGATVELRPYQYAWLDAGSHAT
jgi:glycosidase